MLKAFDLLIMFFCRVSVAGLSPRAPGTMGSFFGLVLALWLFMPFSLTVKIIILVALFVVGSLASTRAEKILGCTDPKEVVIDEVLGQWIAMLPLSCAWVASQGYWLDFVKGYWFWILLSFVLFRFFDILKPGPVRKAEIIAPCGWGIMLDDLVAGIFAAIVLWIGLYLFGVCKVVGG